MFERYIDEMRTHFDYLPVWLPNTHLELGDVGTLHRDRFERETSLAELGIQFRPRERDHDIDFEYASAGNASIDVTGDAEPTRVAVSFRREHGVVFQATACRSTEIADRHTLGRTVLALAETGQWQRNWVVVTEVVTTGPTVVLISSENDARIDLTASLPVQLALAVPLASASAALEVVSSRGIGVKFIAHEGLTPLFRASGVRRRLFGDDRFGHRGEHPNPSSDVHGPGVAEFTEILHGDELPER